MLLTSPRIKLRSYCFHGIIDLREEKKVKNGHYIINEWKTRIDHLRIHSRR